MPTTKGPRGTSDRVRFRAGVGEAGQTATARASRNAARASTNVGDARERSHGRAAS